MRTPPALLIITLLFQFCASRPPTDTTTCFTGKLIKRGNCGQRVVQLQGTIPKRFSLSGNWTDTISGQRYTNVFTVANSCDFPAALKLDEAFTFTVTVARGSSCVQCYSYTPVPPEKNAIVVGCTR